MDDFDSIYKTGLFDGLSISLKYAGRIMKYDSSLRIEVNGRIQLSENYSALAIL